MVALLSVVPVLITLEKWPGRNCGESRTTEDALESFNNLKAIVVVAPEGTLTKIPFVTVEDRSVASETVIAVELVG